MCAWKVVYFREFWEMTPKTDIINIVEWNELILKRVILRIKTKITFLTFCLYIEFYELLNSPRMCRGGYKSYVHARRQRETKKRLFKPKKSLGSNNSKQWIRFAVSTAYYLYRILAKIVTLWGNIINLNRVTYVHYLSFNNTAISFDTAIHCM